MTEQKIRDFYGRIVGTLETDSQGNVTARDFYGRIKGKYQKYDDTTRDFYNRVISKGNTVASLLYT